MSLSELAERCEQAPRPDPSLDKDIAAAVLNWPRWSIPGNRSWQFTASLDAAMTLVPEGWARRIEDWPRPAGQTDIASDDGPNAKAVLMECSEKRIGKQVIWGFHTPGSLSFEARAATPVLALCAAALKARAASVDTRAKRGDSTQIEAPSPMGSAVRDSADAPDASQ